MSRPCCPPSDKSFPKEWLKIVSVHTDSAYLRRIRHRVCSHCALARLIHCDNSVFSLTLPDPFTGTIVHRGWLKIAASHAETAYLNSIHRRHVLAWRARARITRALSCWIAQRDYKRDTTAYLSIRNKERQSTRDLSNACMVWHVIVRWHTQKRRREKARVVLAWSRACFCARELDFSATNRARRSTMKQIFTAFGEGSRMGSRDTRMKRLVANTLAALTQRAHRDATAMILRSWREHARGVGRMIETIQARVWVALRVTFWQIWKGCTVGECQPQSIVLICTDTVASTLLQIQAHMHTKVCTRARARALMFDRVQTHCAVLSLSLPLLLTRNKSISTSDLCVRTQHVCAYTTTCVCVHNDILRAYTTIFCKRTHLRRNSIR